MADFQAFQRTCSRFLTILSLRQGPQPPKGTGLPAPRSEKRRYIPRTLATSFLVTLLASCATQPKAPPPPPIGKLVVEFQNGQTAVVNLDEKQAHYGLSQFVAGLAGQGYYNGQFVYRQVPGYFVLAGKSRLTAQTALPGLYGPAGITPTLPEAQSGQVGAVVHADGAVGPELILQYGWSVADEDTEPQNIRIGTLKMVHGSLKSVQRGDKIWRITYQSPAPTTKSVW